MTSGEGKASCFSTSHKLRVIELSVAEDFLPNFEMTFYLSYTQAMKLTFEDNDLP